MSKKPLIKECKTIASGRLFRIEQLDLEFANGAQRCYERLAGNSSGGVMIIPLLDDDTVLLIREYAAGVERYELGLPKGHLEAHEDPLAAANRELMEEVGYGAKSLQHFTRLTASPGYLAGEMHVVLAQQLYPARLPGDEPEPLEVVPWRLSDLTALTARPDVSEGRSIAALFMVREFLQAQSCKR